MMMRLGKRAGEASEEPEVQAGAGPDAHWAALRPLTLDPAGLARGRVIAGGRADPAHVPFDLLRTRMARVLRERGWRRIGITSASPGCGKTFVTANLVMSFARRASCRVVAMDLDLRIPSLARALGLGAQGLMEDMLAGRVAPSRHLRRVKGNLALGLNDAPARNPAELLEERATAEMLARIEADLAPEVILYDLPPTLVCDDVLAFLPRLDAVLLVAAGGVTTAAQIRACETAFGDTPLLGMILNRAEDVAVEPYYA